MSKTTEITPLEAEFGANGALVESYGGGGFRIGGMDYVGSVLIVRGRVLAWEVKDFTELSEAHFADLFVAGENDSRNDIEASAPELLFLGCGVSICLPPLWLRRFFENKQVALDFMSTGAASRTYNIAFAEQRRVAAALIAIA